MPRPVHFLVKIPQHHVNIPDIPLATLRLSSCVVNDALCHSSSASDALTQAEPNTTSRPEIGKRGSVRTIKPHRH